MRVFLALLVLLGTAGCTDTDWANVASYVRDHGTFGDDSAVSADRAPVALPIDRHCQEVASDRSADVADQGFDSDTRKAVYDSAYADCVAWAARASNVTTK